MASPSAAPFHRPLGVAILAILVILAGLASVILLGLAIFGVAFLDLVIPQAPTGLLLGILGVAFVLALILLASGIGLWRMRRWAWFLAILATLGGLGFQLYGWYIAGRPSLTTGEMISIGLSALIFIYLLAVSKYFGRRRAPA